MDRDSWKFKREKSGQRAAQQNMLTSSQYRLGPLPYLMNSCRHSATIGLFDV